MSFQWLAQSAAESGFETVIACVCVAMIVSAVSVFATIIVATIREG